MSVENKLAADLICYNVAFEYRRERAAWNPLRFIFGRFSRRRINPKYLVIHKEGDVK